MNSNLDINKISSRQNAWFKDLRDWTHSTGFHKAQQKLWLEGDHLCEAARQKNFAFDTLVFRDDCPQSLMHAWASTPCQIAMVTPSLMEGLSSLKSAPMMAAIVSLPLHTGFKSDVSTVVLDQLQDPGNAGSILRSAAALGFKQCVSTHNTVGLWSHKVVRSGMGAHFSLDLVESMDVKDIQSSGAAVALTSSHEGAFLDELVASKSLPFPILWVFGHEGNGYSKQWSDAYCFKVRIRQAGGQESLNVAAAAAICLHASASQLV